ncbi:hypothetical protein Tco_0782511 [Tanacetum coccineum]
MATNATEFWCHSISGAKLSFDDVAPLFEFGTKSLTPPLPVLLEQLGHHLHMGPTAVGLVLNPVKEDQVAVSGDPKRDVVAQDNQVSGLGQIDPPKTKVESK